MECQLRVWVFLNYTKRLSEINVKHKTTLFYRIYFVSCQKSLCYLQNEFRFSWKRMRLLLHMQINENKWSTVLNQEKLRSDLLQLFANCPEIL